MNKEAILAEFEKQIEEILPLHAFAMVNKLEKILNPLPDDNEIAKRLYQEFLKDWYDVKLPFWQDPPSGEDFTDWLDSRGKDV